MDASWYNLKAMSRLITAGNFNAHPTGRNPLPQQVQTTGHAADFFSQSSAICAQIDVGKIEALASALNTVRERGGRLFMLGVGGSAGNCSHAVNDFRKLCGIETYSPVDNVSELTARTNDEGWDTIFAGWLEVSRLNERDAIFIFSVGGGDAERNVSTNLVKAVDFARMRGAKVFGIVGKETGYTAKNGDVVVVVPQVKAEWVTPLSEAFHAVVWHCLVSHPALQIRKTKW
jgi:D-sedoheptulose 7-phosphate isomerase